MSCSSAILPTIFVENVCSTMMCYRHQSTPFDSVRSEGVRNKATLRSVNTKAKPNIRALHHD